jgi:HD-GYP domain-containing protein (c-di-GMP phosphodiesterase class II)
MSAVSTSNSLSLMNELRRLRNHIRELGWSFSVWDNLCQVVDERDQGSDFCHEVLSCQGCLKDDAALAREVLDSGQPTTRQGPCGCCKLGVPVHQRRRLLGAVVTGYPTRTMGEEANLQRMSSVRGLDLERIRPLAAAACRYSEKDAGHFLQILQWMLDQEHAVEVSQKEIATLSTNLANTYEELSLVYRISSAMKVTQQPREFLQDVCNDLAEVMNIGGVIAVSYAYPSSGDDDEVVVAGEVDLNHEQIKLFCATQVVSELAAGNRTAVCNDFKAPPESGLGGGISNFLAAPLSSDKDPLGMVVAINKRTGDFDSVDMKLLGSIANQAAVSLANHRLYADLQDLLMGVLHALTATIDAKDPYTCGHSQRVAMISRKLAEMCGFTPAKVQQVYLMGLLHDIGKIGVPEAVLCKPGRLTDEEFELIKKHPAVGARILGGIRQLDDVVAGILTHHERLDGRGYPNKLQGDQVPFEGRIVGLADCFDAMTSNRTYRAALPLAAVLEEIRKHSGTQFEPTLVEKFLTLDLEKFLKEIHAPAKTVFPIVPMMDRGPTPEPTQEPALQSKAEDA